LNDYKPPGMDLVIEKGTNILISVHSIHHDSRYYYDPECFDPERFTPEEIKKRPNFSFLPFGGLKIND
jgi:cytochrome P450 family 6